MGLTWVSAKLLRVAGRRSEDCRHLLKRQARATREQLGIVAVADVDQDVGLDLTLRKELLLDLRGVEPGHRACVEADRAQREDQVGDLQRAVVKR